MTGLVTTLLGLLVVAVLTLGTAIFVAAEFSLTALERSQVDTHAQQVGDSRALTVQRAHRTLSFQLSGAQLGISATTLVTGIVAKPAIAALLEPGLTALRVPAAAAEPIALVVALLLATALSMIFGELVPKNLAIARPLATARAVAGAQAGFSGLFRWFIHWLNGSANWVVRRLGVEPAEELRSARSPQELGSLVRSSAAQGTLDQGTAALLDRSLRFGDRTADELMTPRVRVEALRVDATVLDLIAAARRTGFSRFPVHAGDLDDIKGAVHVKQAFAVPAAQRATTPVSALTRPVPTVPETLDGDALLDRLRGSGLQMAVVVDEYGGTAGLVTLEDLVEEIVGDVRDEHDRLEVAPVRPLGRTSWMVSGLLRGDEVAEATGFRIPDGDYETLAGFVLARLGRIPSVGDEVLHEGWRLTVMRMDRHRVAELRVSLAPERAPERQGDPAPRGERARQGHAQGAAR
ncbi:Hemolysin, contains CBS domains [Streptoalloteichus tenebrarius]|uniref:Hemolysin, contains CBS domains n=1 Tax=Streptoalloteichus tenebrarius (strain ATCC 17920 / DSM 40477 / JCM 4838 / CBS 697.72 / NBRC 16177 / NCIMB 11028 / NRRL B-12390 / A12253. 1 / ISP 5477) TaxID=1933 RepID=A0ABT1HQS2_STRSD|nr:hemolysin family protein [Streptoalloteichus tenebrarius]MCP2257865.1 Hemolysin, contains CBS domains [Streptoalloteichus tenebrarius]BFE99773.1 hemolysin family protein [Streptoalloteichus tenebrarius]